MLRSTVIQQNARGRSGLVPSGRIAELDGLRAFAAVAVVLCHTYGSAMVPEGPNWMATVADFLGAAGVHVFFVISGYIITRLLMEEKTATGRVSLIAFYIRRVLRILPPFALYVIVVLLMKRAGYIYVSFSDVLRSIFFLGDMGFPDSDGWFVCHTWSLSVEEQYYLLFPP